MRLKPKLLNQCIQVRRSKGGQYVHGLWEANPPELIEVTGSIQPTMSWLQLSTLREGDRSKESITVFSDDMLYVAEEGGSSPKESDYVQWKGFWWKVVSVFPYEVNQRLDHCESIAVKEDTIDQPLPVQPPVVSQPS